MKLIVRLPYDGCFCYTAVISNSRGGVLTGEEVIIAKHGKPIDRITALKEPGRSRIPGRNKNKGSISENFNDPLPDELQANYFSVLSITPPHVFELLNLPDIHRDPFDRILIAQSKNERLSLLTNNRIIKRYRGDTAW